MPVAVEKKVMFSPECLEKPPDKTNSVIFQTVVPRRRKDKFGRDATSQSDFLLSATVFPTGVRAPALEELQQKCGPVCRVDPLRDGLVPGEAWPGSGPKILTLRKSKSNNNQDSPRSSQYLRTSVDSMSNLRSYSWARRGQARDVRDAMYINTYCPDERPLRFKESSLPKIAKGRPWSVGESNPSKRFVKLNNEARKSAGRITSKTRIRGTPLQRSREPFHTAANKQDSEQYFEVKRVSADQRIRHRGQENCLYTQVRQCMRLVKNHDPQRGRQTERPMKAEVGRYRPFSTTRIRTPCPSPTPPMFMYKDQDSADTYRQYVMTKVLQTRVSGAKSAGTVVSGAAARNNTAASTYHDTESQIVQSVADSNIPDIDPKASSEMCSEDSQVDARPNDLLHLGLDIRGATIVPPKSVKSRATDSEYSEKAPTLYSPKKEVLITRRRERSKTSEKSVSEMSVKVTPRPVYTPEPEPISIQLDESGNPLIWQHTPLNVSTPDSDVIKIPAVGMSMLSIDDTEDTDTHDEG